VSTAVQMKKHGLKTVEEYFNCAKTVDVHNNYRQGGLALEEMRTCTWWWRIFMTVLGIIQTDSYLAYQAVTHNTSMSHNQFTGQLAVQLSNNRLDDHVYA